MVEQAYALGHTVSAFVRNRAALEPYEDLEQVRGDVLDAAAVSRAVDGQEAVLCALGGAKGVRVEGTRNIVAAMQQQGVQRLIAVSSWGVGDSRRGIVANLAWLFLRQALEEHQAQEEIIRHSGLDWTILRPTRLTDGPLTGKYRVGHISVGLSPQISRADVADFALKQLADTTYLHQAPTISY
jgi:putative NADH-flavin reductase